MPGRADAQVAAAVVQAVAVDMIDEHSLRRFHDLAVHEYEAAAIDSFGVMRPVVRRRLDLPLVPAEPFVVLGVDDGVHATGQGDIADAVIGRLGRVGAEGLGPIVATGLDGDRAPPAGHIGVIGALAGRRKPRGERPDPQGPVRDAEFASKAVMLRLLSLVFGPFLRRDRLPDDTIFHFA